jgi:kynureninase
MSTLPVSKDDFECPQATYLAGMSLGCLPALSHRYLTEELAVWRDYAVQGHSPSLHPHHRSWYHVLEARCNRLVARLVGAGEEEVAVMGELTANLNMLFTQFYKPTPRRYKVVMEAGPFPSDRFLVEGHVERMGLNKEEEAIVYVEPGENGLIDDQHIVDLITTDPSVCMVFLGAVNYYTGQLYDCAKIASAARANNITLGLDLAHAIGNVPIHLSEWDIDFAAWCSYKYLNSGPGGIAGIYVNARHHDVQPVFRGWWGCEEQLRIVFAVQGARKRLCRPGHSHTSRHGQERRPADPPLPTAQPQGHLRQTRVDAHNNRHAAHGNPRRLCRLVQH